MVNVTKLYLIVVEGDVEPHIHGPYRDAKERVAAAREFHREDPLTRGIFALDVPERGADPIAWAYASKVLE